MENQILDSEILNNASETTTKWAGFWIRVGASLLDTLIFSPLVALSFYNLYNLKNLPIQLFIIVISTVYKPYMEYKYGATLGKMIVKIKVVNADFENISISQSVNRYIPWLFVQLVSLYTTIILFKNSAFLNANGMMEVGNLQNELVSPHYNSIASLILLVSCIVVAFSKNKQGLHDMLANTACVYKEEK